MRILALDQASVTSGYAIFEDKALIEYGHFTASGNDLAKRLKEIRNKVSSLVDDYQIDEVVLEDIQLETHYANNVVTYKALAEVIGVITELLVEKHIKFSLIGSGTWRSNLGINAKSRTDCKAKAQAYVKRIYDIEATEDTCDAICIGTYKVSDGKIGGHDWS